MELIEGSRSTLHSALLVNKAWAGEAIRFLWQNTPVKALAAIKDRDRRQFYARHVQRLSLEDSYWWDEKKMAEYATLRDVELPLLKYTRIIAGTKASEYRNKLYLSIECCIQPSLEEVCFCGDELHSEVIRLLRWRCPKLKKIEFRVDKFHGPGIIDLAELIDSCKSLRSIYLRSGGQEYRFYDGRVSDSEMQQAEQKELQHEQLLQSLLWSLAHCNCLEELTMNTIRGYRPFYEVSRQLEQPTFKDLRNLTLEDLEDARSVSVLASKLNPDSLASLDVTIDDNEVLWETDPNIVPIDLFQQISLLVNLQYLSIYYCTERPSRSDMVPLKNLKRLRSLTICYQRTDLFPTLADEVFITMVENWPELEVLELKVSSKLSTASLTSLRTHCPQLEDLIIDGEYDLNDWQDIPRPVFPQLRSLILDDLVDRERDQSQ